MTRVSADDWQRAVLGETSAGGSEGGPSAVRQEAVEEALPPGAAPSLDKAPAVPVVVSDHSPQPVPALAPEVAALVTGGPARGDDVVARTLRALRSLFASSSAAEVERARRVAAVLQKPVTTGRQIVVTSVQGGVGKT